MTRVLVTGGAGFVGANVSVSLAARHPDWELIALDNLYRRGSELNVPRLESAGIRFVRGDVRDPAALAATGPIDALVECSAEPSALIGADGDVDYAVHTNLTGAYNCLELARSWAAQYAMLELARAHVDPAYQPHRDPDAAPYASIYVGGIGAGTYLEGVDRYGSFTFSLDELRAQEELVRQGADATLAGALSLHLEPADSSKPATTCREAAPAAPGAPVFLELPRGGAVLRSDAEAPVKVQLARFAGLGAVPVGTLPSGGFAELRIPADAAPEPWRAALASEEPVTVCELPDAAGGALGGSGPP